MALNIQSKRIIIIFFDNLSTNTLRGTDIWLFSVGRLCTCTPTHIRIQFRGFIIEPYSNRYTIISIQRNKQTQAGILSSRESAISAHPIRFFSYRLRVYSILIRMMGAMHLRTVEKINRRLEQPRIRPVVCMARHHVEPHAALSLSTTHYGYASSRDVHGLSENSTSEENVGESSVIRNQGASCAWPRACEWPMKDTRTTSEIAQNVMSDAAAAAAVSGAVDWTPEAIVYTRNDQVDTDLPPDVELIALFSDSPISWRAHESEDDEDDEDSSDVASFWDNASKRAMKWWGKMWRYQGLGL